MSTILDALRKARNNSPEAVVMDEEKVLTQRVEECPPLVSEAPREQLQLMRAVLAFAALVIVAMCVLVVFLLSNAFKSQGKVSPAGEKQVEVAGAIPSQIPAVGAGGGVPAPPAVNAVATPAANPEPRPPEPVKPVGAGETKSSGSVPPPTFPQVVGEGGASLPMVPVPPEEDPLDETHVQVLKGLLDEQQAAAAQVQGVAPAATAPRPEPVAAPKPRKDNGELTLDGIVYTEQNPVAMINGEVVPVGGTIGKARVTRITPDVVVLERDGKTIELRQK
ncbi:MAG TPA: hypothetical protein PKH31_01775 [Candidatus Sumerlaeota bacterium]|nr:hypothetical protein [Candidatus Sumerlaeota bacterium]